MAWGESQVVSGKWCFSTNTVPSTWKTACIVPVRPKRLVISSMNDLRPVALTSAVMKVCERAVLCMKKLVKDYIDPLQFAYRKNRSTDDAILYLSLIHISEPTRHA